eukprot:gene34858-46828_t
MKGNLNYETYRFNSKLKQTTPSALLSTDGNNIYSLSENKKLGLLMKNDEDELVIRNPSVKHSRAPYMENNRNRISSNLSKNPIRPSLSEQLAMITAQAETLTKEIRSLDKIRNMKEDLSPHHNEFQLLFTMPAKYFEIGTLTCRYPSPVFFYTDRCEYIFSHPYESASIKMIMHYKDMISATVANFSFKFKLPKKLAHFSADFDPTNPNHSIKIELATKINSDTIKYKIIPLITA